MTQEQIGKEIGWSESKVKQYGTILTKIVTMNLNFAKNNQEGRVTNKVTTVTFTERWFREILKLDEDHQHDIIDEYIQNPKMGFWVQKVTNTEYPKWVHG